MTFDVTPIGDLDPWEAIETVIAKIISSSTNNAYEFLAPALAVVNLRDRAAVQFLKAKAGSDINTLGQAQRDVTNRNLTLIQDDVGDFVAVPTPGGDFQGYRALWAG